MLWKLFNKGLKKQEITACEIGPVAKACKG